MVKPVSKKILQLVALKAIAKHILTIPAKEWNMETWYRVRDCGTVGCAIGHSRDLPEVKALGLRVESQPCLRDANLYYQYYQPIVGNPPVGWHIENGMPAVAHAFGISIETANHMFGSRTAWGTTTLDELAPLKSDLSQQAVHDRIMEVVNGEYK